MRTLGLKAVLLKAAGLCTVLLTSQAWAADEPAETASNPLAKGRNTDLRYQAFDVDDQSHQQTVSIEGAFMALPDLKIKYEAHYSETDVTGSSERGWEQFSLKGIYFPKEGKWGKWGYRVAVGLEHRVGGVALSARSGRCRPQRRRTSRCRGCDVHPLRQNLLERRDRRP